MTALLFPGQGVAIAECARAWFEASAATRRLLARAADDAGLPLRSLLHASGEALRDTAAYQPAAVALCLGVNAELEARGVTPSAVAGHSLGELAACAAARVLSPESAVDLAAVRGRLMARAARRHPGGMVALRLAGREAAAAAVRSVAGSGTLAIAAHNGPDEFVLSGPWPALRALAPEYRPVPLDTGGPWHSEAMEEAVDEYRRALRRALRGPARVTLACNAGGAVVRPGDDLAELLAGQLTHTVEWAATLRTLSGLGVSCFLTVGPAKALRGLVRRSLPGARVQAVDLPEQLPAPVAEAVP